MKKSEKLRIVSLLLIGITWSLIFISCSNETREAKVESQLSKDTEAEYQKLKTKLQTGWNTWDNRSVLTHVYLPDGLALVLGLEDTHRGNYRQEFFTGNRIIGSDRVRTIAHTPDGSFTHLSLEWQNINIRVRTAAEDEDLYIVVSPDAWLSGHLHVKANMPYGHAGEISLAEEQIIAKTPQHDFQFYITGQKIDTVFSDALIYNLEQPIYISTRELPVEAIKQKIDAKEEEWLAMFEPFGGSYTEAGLVYGAIQNAINWLPVYDPELDRIVTPVSRNWAYGWGKGEPGGFVLFCWDNFFVSWMHALESKELAYNEAIQMCNLIDQAGFVPNFAGPGGSMSFDRSQPPVGSMVVKKIYQKYQEKWFLQYNFEKLLTWNRWWDKNRNNEGLLTWGSSPYTPSTDDKRQRVQNVFKAASFESGLDNTPMYDGVEYDTTTHMLKIQDVGLTGLYLMDCEALAYLAQELGKTQEYEELTSRAEKYRQAMQTLWDDEFGLFLNRHTDTEELSKRISPTNFYALNGEAANQQKAQRMMDEHFYNPDEFWGDYIMPSIARNDTAYTGESYWRGSIWAPMNLLVYWGMQNYDLPHAKQDMAEKSKELLLKSWLEKGWIRENYHAETGSYNNRSEHFYHWGALLGMIYLDEQGYLKNKK
jgi:putative isomerase